MTERPLIIAGDEQDLGRRAAEHIVAAIKKASVENRPCVIGCPSGRTPRSTYRATAEISGRERLNLQHVYIAMMDEFVDVDVQTQRLTNVDPGQPFSCTGFAQREILAVINAAVLPGCEIPEDHLVSPNASDPNAYERWLRSTGVDVFILASGARDGHVAFNGPGTPRDATTRIVKLADLTRQDNVDTFPAFSRKENVPEFGVTVGPSTIADISRSALMLIHGSHKQDAAEHIIEATTYDPQWPSTIIWDCHSPSVLIDSTALPDGQVS